MGVLLQRPKWTETHLSVSKRSSLPGAGCIFGRNLRTAENMSGWGTGTKRAKTVVSPGAVVATKGWDRPKMGDLYAALHIEAILTLRTAELRKTRARRRVEHERKKGLEK